MKTILLFGPTAVGKTELISKLLKSKYEIINADSMQVYCGLDVGTAKPSLELQNNIKHHLIDIILPTEQFHAGEFVRLADKFVFDISSRGKIPVISGGTAFYFKNYLFGLPEIPGIEPSIRGELQKELLTQGIQVLYNKLMYLDPLRAERIHPNDKYRILRALEIIQGSGRLQSDFKPKSILREGIDPLILGLRRDRLELYSRINQRVDLMFEEGLIFEIKKCFSSGLKESDPGMKGIGYKEFFQMGRRGDLTVTDIRDSIKINSRRYAKRQITFFKALPNVKWFEPCNIISIKKEIESYLSM